MDKLFTKEPSYYRMNLSAGNLLYFGHAIDVKDDDYITLTMKDIIAKIDELVEVYNQLSTRLAVSDIATEVKTLEARVNLMQETITALVQPKQDSSEE